jgi:hypothetical protein
MIAAMRRSFNGLLRDFDVMSLALAIPIGWALYQVAHGVGQFVSYLTVDSPDGTGGSLSYIGPLAWSLSGHIVYLGSLVVGLVELAVVVSVAAVVHARFMGSPAVTESVPEPDSRAA